MKYFVLGVSHKACPIEIREKLHFARTQTESALRWLRSRAAGEEWVLLSTCNRVEFYGFTESGEVPAGLVFDCIESVLEISRDAFLPYLYRYEGREAIRHLFRVASGLDSLVIGENEILGQVRNAFRLSHEFHTAHSLLYRLMEKALKVGKDVRAGTRINRGAVSIPSVAVELAEKIFGRLAGQKVLVLGTGDMGTLALKSLRDSGAEVVGVVSRNAGPGRKVAEQFETEWIPFDRWQASLVRADILIACSGSPFPVIHYEQIREIIGRRHHRALFLIDIAVPRSVDPGVNKIDDVYLYNVDDLRDLSAGNLRMRHTELKASEEIVDQAFNAFLSWLEQLKARPTLERFERLLDGILESEIGNLAKEYRMEPASYETVRRRIRSKLLHYPIMTIKETSQNGGSARYLEALRSLFKL